MKVEFEFAIGEKVFLKCEAKKGLLSGSTIVSASIFQNKGESKKHYRTEDGFNRSEDELLHEKNALDFVADYYISRLDAVNALRNRLEA